MINLKTDRVIIAGLTLAAFILWLSQLGNLALRDWDEGYYATVSQDMFNRQAWFFPTYQGQPFWLKPPLLLWLIHLSYQVGGVNEFSSRFPSAVITALGVPLVYLVGQALFKHRLTAFFSATVYLTLLPVVRLGRLAMLDGMINTFLLLSLWGLLQGLTQPVWLILVGLGLGLIALSKGVLAIAFLGLLLGFILWDRQYQVLRSPWWWLGLGLGFLPVIGWYGLQIQQYGAEFIRVHFLAQSVERLNTAVEGNTGPFFFYGLEVLKYTAPWLFFFLPGMVRQWQQLPQRSAKFTLGIGLGFFLLISLMQTKLPWYVLPFYIFFALMTGDYLSYLTTQAKTYPRLITYLLGLVSLVGLGGWIYFTFIAFQWPLSLMAGCLTLTLSLTTFYFYRHQSQAFWCLIGGLYLTLWFLMISPVWNWELNEAFAVKPVGALLKAQTPPQTIIYTSFAYSRPSLDFYSDRQVLAVGEKELQELAQQSHYLLLQPEVLKKLPVSSYRKLGQTGIFTLIKTHKDPS